MTVRIGWLKLKCMSVADWRAPGGTGMTAWDGGWPSGLKSMVRLSRSAFSGKALRMLHAETPGQNTCTCTSRVAMAVGAG